MLALFVASLIFAITHAFPCCMVHSHMDSCISEIKGGSCVWVEEKDELLATEGINCVATNYYDCKVRDLCPKGFYDPPTSPGSPCDMEECPHEGTNYNVLFAIDSTKGLSKKDFKKSLDFIENVIYRQVQANANIAVVVFNGAASPVVYPFSAVYDQKKAATAALKDALKGYDSEAETCLTDVIDEILSVYEDAPDAVLNYLYLLATGEVEGDCSDPCAAEAEYADKLQNFVVNDVGIERIVLGMGLFVSNDHVRCLVEADPLLVTIPSYTEEDFYTAESDLRPSLCIPDPGTVDAVAVRTVAYKGGLLYNLGLKNGMTAYLVLFAVFIVGALGYYYRQKLCNKEKKLVIGEGHETYGSVQQI